jgi:uncharacterized protein (DUF2126 family)
MKDALLAEVQEHDQRLAQHGIDIWIGSEPTFTNARSQDPCWLTEALGGEKEAHAKALLVALASQLPGPLELLQVYGRLYPGETTPRFCYGALYPRNGAPSGDADMASCYRLDLISATPTPRADQAWLTVTPDPAVVEVNMAPAHNLTTFARWTEMVFRAANAASLSPERMRYNGDVTDSGGGGQITLGGPTPERSPFFVWPELLPGLVRYTNRHPSLSYYFASACCGSASQAPRADEGVRERFDELGVALDYLATRGAAATPKELWGMLSPLLVDASGCSHRAELNIEKLWNPWFGGRGQLGLVELRALRMPKSPECMVAIAALFRAIAARLALHPYTEPLIDWGSQLHESASLPWHLERDLEAVLADLEQHGFGLGPELRACLLAPQEPIVKLRDGNATLELSSAISFWPLLGDAVLQATQGARLVDSSTTRVQVLVSAPRGLPLGEVAANGFRIPLQPVHPNHNHSRNYAVGSVTYRSFVPQLGLHPNISAHDPWNLEWSRSGRNQRVQLHAWHANGGSYEGLPLSASEAKARRAARVVSSIRTEPVPFKSHPTARRHLDLRSIEPEPSAPRLQGAVSWRPPRPTATIKQIIQPTIPSTMPSTIPSTIKAGAERLPAVEPLHSAPAAPAATDRSPE